MTEQQAQGWVPRLADHIEASRARGLNPTPEAAAKTLGLSPDDARQAADAFRAAEEGD